MTHRVFLCKAGVVSPIGTGWDEFCQGVMEGRPGSAELTVFDGSLLPVHLAAEVRVGGVVVSSAPEQDRKSIFLSMAADELLASHKGWGGVPPAKRWALVGGGIEHFDLGGYTSDPAPDWRRYQRHLRKTLDEICLKHGVGGVRSVNVSACVGATQAMGVAFRHVRSDPGLAILTGGTDSMLSPLHYMGFHHLGALSEWAGDPALACRPFDADRCGIVLGEGAGLTVVQSELTADPSEILAEIVGYGTSLDAHMVTDPDPEGTQLARCALDAIEDAGIRPDDVDCVHLHGTGTPKNEPAEAAAMRKIFGTRAGDVPVYSLKGQVGHLVGACGVVETFAAALCLREQVVLPTVNCVRLDQSLGLRVVQDRPLSMPMRHVLKLNAAFGGQNAALVLRRVP
ncbi:MAG: beta-ketoacyl-[acyl-carrier-protein] synthase family protein [Fibrobacterota bacterium]|nr:beta-ketoacyl-[acyl-carrier-protein] synthase family protein [Fibrobacterota bacterium]QQS07225.1 MAG: beta-ketoacyl-[acyl-carrier-protein] synthase family protein [Fibrobacterota bacterium]